MIEPNFEFLHGRTTKKEIIIPESWEEDIDMDSITIHLTQVGANQDLGASTRRRGRRVDREVPQADPLTLTGRGGLPPPFHFGDFER